MIGLRFALHLRRRRRTTTIKKRKTKTNVLFVVGVVAVDCRRGASASTALPSSVWILHFPLCERERYALNSLFIFFPPHTHEFPICIRLGCFVYLFVLEGVALTHTLTHLFVAG